MTVTDRHWFVDVIDSSEAALRVRDCGIILSQTNIFLTVHAQFTCISLLCAALLHADTLHVGAGQTFTSLSGAVQSAVPGDDIVIHSGTYSGGVSVVGFDGDWGSELSIRANRGDTVVIEGGSEGLRFSDVRHVRIEGLIFRGQTARGVVVDDGGSYDTPSQHVAFVHCTFSDIDAGGGDLLELSGVNDFEIRSCRFVNGAADGNGIDMVGCHRGRVEQCAFEHLGAGSIQARGGSSDILIQRNRFMDGGQRVLQLGGSTDSGSFRPDTASSEASWVRAHANVLIGGNCAVAFAGSVDCDAINNTIYKPRDRVLRIVQEAADSVRSVTCGDNSWRNNIVVIGDTLSDVCDIGPDTRPETFTFSNNLWLHVDDLGWTGPHLPSDDSASIVNADPLFADERAGDFSIPLSSPAAGAGNATVAVYYDFVGRPYNETPAIGAYEARLFPEPHDFSRYTIVDSALKAALRSVREKHFVRSEYTPGNVAVFGNSITEPQAFWTVFAHSDSPGIVPGTNRESYLVDKYDSRHCAVSGYTVGMGLGCVDTALALLKPEVAVCMYGTNDIVDSWEGMFGRDYRGLIDRILAKGVVPIVSTIPPVRFYAGDGMVSETAMLNDSVRALCWEKQVVLVDYWQAMMDYTENNPFTMQWYDDSYVHPSGWCVPDTAAPQCGQGIRNAVTWHAVNKVYRIIVEDGAPDGSSGAGQRAAADVPRTFESPLCLLRSGVGRVVIRVRGPGALTVVDLGGRRIVERILRSSSVHHVVLPACARGMYVVRFLTGSGGVVRQRIAVD